jgi:hypothetical protein
MKKGGQTEKTNFYEENNYSKRDGFINISIRIRYFYMSLHRSFNEYGIVIVEYK